MSSSTVTVTKKEVAVVTRTAQHNFVGVGTQGPAGAAGVGVVAGGLTGQVLAKASGNDFETEWSDAGAGDMAKSVYDSDNDGKVDAAEVADAAPWAGITGKPATYAPSTHTHTATNITQDSTHRFVTDDEKTTWNSKEAGGAVAAHEADLDPHPQYLTPAEGAAAYDAIGSAAAAQEAAALDATSKANAAQAASTPVAHATNTSNPHSVTKAQVGLGSVDNTADVDKPVSSAQAAADAIVLSAAATDATTKANAAAAASTPVAHATNTGNPHSVTRGQVGLGNVDNTSDVDKPVSYDQAIALGLKLDATHAGTGGTAHANAVAAGAAGFMTGADKTKLDGIAAGAQVNVATNLAQGTRTTTTVPITSSTGASATLGVATTSLAGVMSSADKTKLDGIATSANNYSLPAATSTVRGGIELFSDTVQSVAATAVSTTASRTYGVQVNSDAQGVVNVPWTDTVYTHPASHPPSIITQDASNRFVTDTEKSTWNGKEGALTAGTTSQYYRGDKSWQTLDKTAVGLSNVDNTSDATKNAATATLTNKTLTLPKLTDTTVDVITNLFPLVRPTLNLRFDKKIVDPRIVTTRAGTQTYFDSLGVMQTAPANTLVIDHAPITHECLGASIWGARTNLLTYSEQFDNAVWKKRSETVIEPNSILAPDGTLTADKHVSAGTVLNGAYLDRAGAFATDNTVYCVSAYVKKGTQTNAQITMYSKLSNLDLCNCYYNLDTGVAIGPSNNGAVTGGVAGMQAVGNGWFRIWLSANMLSGSNTTGPRITPSVWGVPASIGSEYGFIWGAQLEVGSYPSPYIPTTTATVTRPATLAKIDGANFTGFYNQSEGTLVVEAVPLTSGTTKGAVSIDDGTGAERIQIRHSGTSAISTVVVDGNVIQAAPSSAAGSAPIGSLFKAAYGFKENSVQLYVNGAAAVVDASATMPTPTMMTIGFATGVDYFDGYAKSVTYYPTRLSNTELQAISK